MSSAVGSKIHYNDKVPEFMSQISFFCGHHPDCDVFESQQMFRRALINFERSFVVTGVLEHLNSSIMVLETFLPKFFQGSTKLLKQTSELDGLNQNTLKPKVSSQARKQIAENMTREIEFYHIVRQKLFQQYMSIL